jgi:hypothetical protein
MRGGSALRNRTTVPVPEESNNRTGTVSDKTVSFRADKTVNEALDALFLVTIA